MEKKITCFDWSEIYEQKIAPLVAEFRDACERSGIPYYYQFAVKNDDEGTVYVTGHSLCGRRLSDDEIARHILIDKGYRAIPLDIGDDLLYDTMTGEMGAAAEPVPGEPYDAGTAYKKQAAPLIARIEKACLSVIVPVIPYIALSAVNDDGKTTTYRASGIMPGSRGTVLTEDRMKGHLLVRAGCTPVTDRIPGYVLDEDGLIIA